MLEAKEDWVENPKVVFSKFWCLPEIGGFCPSTQNTNALNVFSTTCGSLKLPITLSNSLIIRFLRH
jgi:hypothetical protein